MKTVVVLLCFSLCASAVSVFSQKQDTLTQQDGVSQEYRQYMSAFNKVYSSEEIIIRAKIYSQKVAQINAHNVDSTQTYKRGVNQFTDWTDEETNEWLPLLAEPPKSSVVVETLATLPQAPASVDWREKGAVNAVKDQGQCGVCWAFGSTAAVESAHFIATGKLVSMSESQQVTCNKEGGCNECAFQFLKTNAACTEESFPYECPEKRTCPKCVAAMSVIRNYTVIQASNEAALMAAVARQPVAIGIAASGSFMSYSSGIFQGPCPGGRNHAVAIIGYGSENGMDYWIIRNSWGSGWGEKGYIRIRRNVPNVPDGLCLLATDASVPSIN